MPYQESLKVLCPVQLPRLTGAQGNNAADLLLIYLELYGQCAARHNQLITEINQREKMNDE
ncbi:hypothetical protein [Cedecea sp.]|uniref:hypothetical protein n=1 Tax=Cedecea sp. TaxID=1970739 RepID=UPI002F407550